MGNGPEFFQTGMGRKFYEADVPRIAGALGRIADALEGANKLKAMEPSQPHEPVERTAYVVGLERENKSLRLILSRCSAALGNGSGCAPEASLEFMSSLPVEIAEETRALRAEIERLKAYAEGPTWATHREALAESTQRVARLESALATISLMEYESTSSASEKVHAAARKARFALHGEEKP